MPTKRTRRTRNATTIPITPAELLFAVWGPESISDAREQDIVWPTAPDGIERRRLPGWLEALQLAALYIAEGSGDQRFARAVEPWVDVVAAETTPYGFQPWLMMRETPRGEKFSRWRQAFVNTHAY